MTTPSRAPAAHGRKLRNLLLDPGLQLKKAARQVALATIGCGALLVVLFQTTEVMNRELDAGLLSRSQAAETQQALERCKLDAQLHTPEAQADPALAERLKLATKTRHAVIASEQLAAIEHGKNVSEAQSEALSIVGASMLAFLVLVAALSILWSHRTVGPLYRLAKLSREVATGRLDVVPGTLRAGDDLKDLFATFSSMLDALRTQAQADLAAVEAGLAGDRAALERLRDGLAARTRHPTGGERTDERSTGG